MTQDYKLLIKGTLEQQTAFSTGGNMPDSPYVDMHLARNGNDKGKKGKGDFTLRGTGLAGAFMATARQLYETNLTENITEGSPKEQQEKLKANYERQKNKEGGINDFDKWKEKKAPRMHESVYIFHNSHLQEDYKDTKSEIRDNVAISDQTGAAKDGAKFDVQTLPAGTKWDFLLEIDQYRDDSKQATEIALNVIKQWKQRCWLGRDVARGLGWMKLTDVTYYELNTDDIDKWPDSTTSPLNAIKKLTGVKEKQPNEIKKPRLPSISGSITITVGDHSNDGYGVDFLSVGSFQRNEENQTDQKYEQRKTRHPSTLQDREFLDQHRDKLITPLGQNVDKYCQFEREKSKKDKDKYIDFYIAATQTQNGTAPFIPGSSIRGALRHTLQWLSNTNEADSDIVDDIFGSTSQSAKLLIADAMLKKETDWQAVVLEMHAEDEFTQGVYGSGKFDRTCLTKATFTADYYLQADSNDELENIEKELQKLQTLGANQMLPIGGGQWKGLGWVKWDIDINTNSKDEGTNTEEVSQ